MKTLIKKFHFRLLFLSTIFFSALLNATDYYFSSATGDYTSTASWYLDEDRTIPATNIPISSDDTVIFRNMTGTSYINSFDTYVGNMIFTGKSALRYGNKVQAPGGNTVYLDVSGGIYAQVSDIATDAVFGNSFDREENVNVDVTIGEINVGCEIYGNKTFEEHGSTTFYISFNNARISNSIIRVNGDVNIGGGLAVNSYVNTRVAVDKMVIGGVLDFKLNGNTFSNFVFEEAAVLEVGGLVGGLNSADKSDFTICNTRSFSSDIVLKNAAGTDYTFIGNICDDGNSLQYNNSGVVNIIMDGEGTQRIFQSVGSAKSVASINVRQRGTISARNGKLIYDNSRIVADYRQAALSLEGGKFGAGHYDSSLTGTAYFKTANFESGGLAYENFANHNTIETGAGDKIIIAETFTKADGSGKIAIDFSDANGNALNLENYILADSADLVEYWAEILTAGELSGFNLDTLLSDGAYDANADFYAENIENGIAVFKWVESIDNGYSLQVGFAQVPEPAAAVALVGVLALIYAGMKSRRRR